MYSPYYSKSVGKPTAQGNVDRPTTLNIGGGSGSSSIGAVSEVITVATTASVGVITVPPKSGVPASSLAYERPTGPQTHGTHHQYYMQPVGLRVNQQQSQAHGSGGGNIIGSISKSTQNLIESIPDVFCLSCPPAEFKFSEAYRAKTLPRTGKESLFACHVDWTQINICVLLHILKNERLIGFATLPEQVHRKSVKKGFDFTLMAVGESGLGKSTLINSLFLADFYQDRKVPPVSEKLKRTTSIQKHTTEIEERGVKLRLTVIDTPGFGDAINCEDSWRACTDYIDEQFQHYFLAESGLNRRHIQDTRVHCCLYFVPPYGHGLRPLDIEALKCLQTRVNVIPIIAKADTLTPSEVRKLKDQILEDLRVHQIQIYQFPECDEEEDEEFKKQDRELKAAIPFAVASSDTFIEVAGKKLRGRVYPWGIVEVENPSHSDFGKLRTMLIQSHMHDLKETTQDLHYENFRAKTISMSQSASRERSKLKRDSSSDSPQDLLQQKEAEIKRMQQMISKMEAKLKAAGKGTSDPVIDL
ncbi:Septin-5 [Orchesella cincta]|uniref:Septin-5 n=1 Tax=Orchesella cincta TaxID=48709 RepID=A0A1D2NML5_ORCCI|nr:Septin-5 [Orchesella cincta]